MYSLSKDIKQINHGSTALKVGFKHCFILLFAFAFSLQQFTAFAYVQDAVSIASTNNSKPPSWHLFTSSHISFHQFTEPDPLEWEMEFTDEDDEGNNSSRKLNSSSTYKYYHADDVAFNEQLYSSCIQSRFLQFASTADNRSNIPLFVLHHSWKKPPLLII